jgi:hypothetical protein
MPCCVQPGGAQGGYDRTLSDGDLRGLGAGPTGANGDWCAEKAPRLMAVNGDEEPGTFKDRIYPEREPHSFEGMLTRRGRWRPSRFSSTCATSIRRC